MSLKIRMARAGTKKRPVYHIVVADSRSPRDGRFIERLGYFNPLLPKDKTEGVLDFDLERTKAWIAKGASAERPRHALPRRGRPRQSARSATIPRTGDPAQAAQGDEKGRSQSRPRRRRPPLPPRRPRPPHGRSDYDPRGCSRQDLSAARFPRKRESKIFRGGVWVPAFAGTSGERA